MDAQQTEIVGRNLLVSRIVADGVEVARPERDHGIDLIAYVDDEAFVALPIQMKASTNAGFGIARKYERFGERLIIVHVWHVHTPTEARIFAMTHGESLWVGDTLGWTNTRSWIEAGSYSTRSPSKRLLKGLAPFEMLAGDWRRKIEQIAIASLRLPDGPS